MGFRDRERVLERSADEPRYLVAGDSFVYGLAVGRDQAVCARLETLLRPAEVWNLGVCGYSTVQERALLAAWVPRAKPDGVVVAFYPNDLFENLFVGDMAVVGGVLVPAVLRDALSGEGVLRATEWELRLRRSRLYSLLTRAGLTGPVTRLFLAGVPDEARRRASEVQAERARSIATIYRSYFDAESREDESVTRAWKAAFAELDGLRADLEAARVPWRLAVIPDVDTVRWLLEGRDAGSDARPAVPWVHERLRGWASAASVPCVDLLDPFLRARDPLALYEPGAHWSEEGHALAAEAIAGAIREGSASS
jgi:hypothetical protein